MSKIRRILGDVVWLLVLASLMAGGALLTRSLCGLEATEAHLPILMQK